MALTGNLWTLAQLEIEVATFMDDASYERWAQATMAKAIRQALQNAGSRWFEERIDDTATYDSSTFRYTLPPICETVEEVWLEAWSSDRPRRFVVPTMWHIEGNELVFEEAYNRYDGQGLYLVYIVSPANLLTLPLTDGVIASTTTTALTSATATLVSGGVRAGDAVIINKTDYAGNGTYYVVSVDSTTQLTLHKAPGTAGSSLTFNVAHYTDMPVSYIRCFAAAMLYEQAARNRPGVEVSEYLQLASYYRQLADRELKLHRKSRPARRRY